MRKADLILTADWHLRSDVPVCRTDDYMNAQKRKLNTICELAKKHVCKVVIAGDVFHKWNASIEAMRLLVDIPILTDEFRAIAGNHDLPQHNLGLFDKSALGLLSASNVIECLGSLNKVFEDYADCDFIVNGSSFGESPRYVEANPTHRQVLVWHTMTYKNVLPFPGCEAMDAKSVLKKYPHYDLIVTGDNHNTFVEEYEGRILVNPGSLMRMTADQVNHKPCVFLWHAEDNSVEQVFLPIEDNVITRDHIERKEARDKRFDEFLSKMTEGMDELSFEDALTRYIEVNGMSEEVKRILLESLES